MIRAEKRPIFEERFKEFEYKISGRTYTACAKCHRILFSPELPHHEVDHAVYCGKPYHLKCYESKCYESEDEEEKDYCPLCGQKFEIGLDAEPVTTILSTGELAHVSCIKEHGLDDRVEITCALCGKLLLNGKIAVIDGTNGEKKLVHKKCKKNHGLE